MRGKLLADDTSLFSILKNELSTGLDLNNDLEKIRVWVWQWKMQSNADKTEEVVFLWKTSRPLIHFLKLGKDEITTSLEHKHLGMTLDHKLGFQIHIQEAILMQKDWDDKISQQTYF